MEDDRFDATEQKQPVQSKELKGLLVCLKDDQRIPKTQWHPRIVMSVNGQYDEVFMGDVDLNWIASEGTQQPLHFETRSPGYEWLSKSYRARVQ